MSKSRTGRKGRVRLAVAAALGDLDAAVGGDSIVDADGRLGTGSGHRSDDAAKSNAAILDLVQSQLAKPGSENALFAQGEVRGPLANSVDTRNGATGVFSGDENVDPGADGVDTALAHGQNITGEVDASKQLPLSNSASGMFAHYVLPDASEVDGTKGVAAVTQAAGGVITNTGARAAQIVSSDAFGICYHQGGPGSDFVPVQHLGGAAGATFGASCISLEPSMDTIYGAVTAAQVSSGPANVEIQILGNKIASVSCDAATAAGAGGDAGEKRDEILISESEHTAASAAFIYKRDAVGGAGDAAHMPQGAEIVIRGKDGVLLSIIAKDASGDGVTLDPDGTASITGAGIGTGGNANGKNFYHDTTSGTNKVYIVSPKSVGGATAYPAAGGGEPASQVSIAETMIAAINSLADQEKLGITASISGTTDVKVTMDRLRGAAGNNSDDSAGANLTITAYSSNGQVAVPAAGNGHNFFGDVANGDAAAAHVEFAGGAQVGANYGRTQTRLAAQNTQVSVNVSPQNFPVRISYISNANVKRDVASGATHGIGSAQIDCGMLLAANERVTLRFTVPKSRGGEGVTDIVVDEADTTGATGDGASAIGMGSQGLAGGGGPAASAAILVNAINGKAVATSTPATSGSGTLEDATGGLNFGIKGVVAEDAGGGIVNVFLGPAAEGFAEDGTPDCTVARQSGDLATSAGVVRHSFQPAGQPIDKSGGFAFIWGPKA